MTILLIDICTFQKLNIIRMLDYASIQSNYSPKQNPYPLKKTSGTVLFSCASKECPFISVWALLWSWQMSRRCQHRLWWWVLKQWYFPASQQLRQHFCDAFNLCVRHKLKLAPQFSLSTPWSHPNAHRADWQQRSMGLHQKAEIRHPFPTTTFQ